MNTRRGKFSNQNHFQSNYECLSDVFICSWWDLISTASSGQVSLSFHKPGLFLCSGSPKKMFSHSFAWRDLCFFAVEDLERNDGSTEKPYFMSSNLRKLLKKTNKETDQWFGKPGLFMRQNEMYQLDFCQDRAASARLQYLLPLAVPYNWNLAKLETSVVSFGFWA